MKISVSAGHAPDPGLGCGAVGLIRESTEAREVCKHTILYLRRAGHEAYDCTCNDNLAQFECLDRIISKHNSHKDTDLDVSIHFNDGSSTKKDGKVTGTEVYVLSKGGDQFKIEVAERVLKSFAGIGLKQHGEGIKEKGYNFLRYTKSPAILIEVCFVGDPEDVGIYLEAGAKKIGKLIAEAIHGKTINDKQISVGDKLCIQQKVKIRSTQNSNYKKIGVLLPGTVVEVKDVNKAKTRAMFAEGMWINCSKEYVSVL